MIQAEAQHLTVLTQHEATSVDTVAKSVTVRDRTTGQESSIAAEIFIDATYEGDLAAMAGAEYLLGRESRDDWNEEYAGKLYMNDADAKEVFPGSTGEGDSRIQAYNFRLCLTRNPANRSPITRPDSYRREEYLSLITDVAEGRIASIRQLLSILPIPNQKTDANNHHFGMVSTDLPEENTAYPEAGWETRERIIERHRQYTQGPLWFLQNDEGLPPGFRAEASEWGYATDEFTETGHFPPQIYVREGPHCPRPCPGPGSV